MFLFLFSCGDLYSVVFISGCVLAFFVFLWTGGLRLYWYRGCGFRPAAYTWMDGGISAGGGKCLLVFGIGTDDGVDMISVSV